MEKAPQEGAGQAIKSDWIIAFAATGLRWPITLGGRRRRLADDDDRPRRK